MKRGINKRDLAVLVEDYRHLLGVPPCCCIYMLKPCKCLDVCFHPIQLEFCSHVEEWSDRDYLAFLEGLGRFYLAIDRRHYRQRNEHPDALLSPTLGSREFVYAQRVAEGFSPFHSADLDSAKVKVGETITNGRNGALVHCGVQPFAIEALTHEPLPANPTFQDVHRLRCVGVAP